MFQRQSICIKVTHSNLSTCPPLPLMDSFKRPAPFVLRFRILPFSLPAVHGNIKGELFILTANTQHWQSFVTNACHRHPFSSTITSVVFFTLAGTKTGSAVPVTKRKITGKDVVTRRENSCSFTINGARPYIKVGPENRYPQIRELRMEARCLSHLLSPPSKLLKEDFLLQFREMNNGGTYFLN